MEQFTFVLMLAAGAAFAVAAVIAIVLLIEERR